MEASMSLVSGAVMGLAATMATTGGMASAQSPYVVHGAKSTCSCGLRDSYVVVPLSHGTYIHSIAQLTVKDCKSDINVQCFGGCTSPENPAVQEAAKKIADEVNSQPKGFLERVVNFFCKSDEATADSFVSQCAAVCTPVILKPWDNGKSTVQINGEEPLLLEGTLTCLYGGSITLKNTGQPE